MGKRKKKRVKRPDLVRPKAKKTKPKAKKKTVTKRVIDRVPPIERVQGFLDTLRPIGDEPVYIGIDPGMEGAFGFRHPVDPSLSTAADIPTVKVETSKKTAKGNACKRTKFDLGGCLAIWQEIQASGVQVVVALEHGQARNTDNGLTGYSVGCGYFMWPLFLMSMGIVCEELIPSVWKRKMGLLGKDKEDSRLLAQRLFPHAPLTNKCHHNRAEALLLAEALYRRRKGDH